MVNFRFHIVSLVAVFLALGVGVLMGSTVIDQATIDVLERNQGRLERRIESRDARIGELARQVEQWESFSGQAQAELLAGRLASVPVLVVTVEGVDEDLVRQVHEWLDRAGADDRGTLELSARFALAGQDDLDRLSAAAGILGRRPDAVRPVALARLATALASGPGAGPPSAAPAESTEPPPGAMLAALRDAGFLRHQPPAGVTLDVASLPRADTRVVVVSGPGARVPDDVLAVPLVRDMIRTDFLSVVAIEPGGPPDHPRPPSLVPALRADDELSARVSTVDNAATFMGQVATVLALEDLASSTRGHYGTGPGADRLVPAPNA